MLYAIDTHTFCWCIKEQVDPQDEKYLAHAKAFLSWVDSSKHQLIIPTVVLAEALIREPQDRHSGILENAHKHFIVTDFDSRAAAKYGELLRLERWQSAQEIRKANGIRREKMKLDHMIVCCAIIHGANGIFSEDEDVITFAKDILQVKSILEIPIAVQLYSEEATEQQKTMF